MIVDRFLHDREPQTRAGVFRRKVRLEDLGNVVCGNAVTGVCDLNLNRVRLGVRKLDLNTAARAVDRFDSIDNEIGEC